jgi:hypothetical protein
MLYHNIIVVSWCTIIKDIVVTLQEYQVTVLEWWVLLSLNFCGIYKAMNNHHKREPKNFDIRMHITTPNKYAKKSQYICFNNSWKWV